MSDITASSNESDITRSEILKIMKDNVEKTPLQIAALLGDIDAVKECLKRGDEVNFAKGEGRTAAHYAAISGNLEIMKCLVESYGANINLSDNYGNRPLHYAARMFMLESRNHE